VKFEIETLDDRRVVTARDVKEAIKKAWRKNPPKEVGLLVRVRSSSRRVWAYIGSDVAVKLAGYKVVLRTPAP
jgi:hypothetical protein